MGDVLVHDPAMVKVGGTYYLYATAPGISIKTSTDRINFKSAGVAFPNGLPWCDAYTESDRNIWAPEVVYTGGQFYMYYSCSSFGSRNSAIFLATSKTGLSGSWTDRGKVYSTTTSSTFNSIDPGLLIDGSKWYLTLGSFGTGIYQLAINPSTGLASSTSLTHLAARGGDNSIEGATIFKHGSWYYLFVAFDFCCRGASSTYRIMVGRSSSPTGGFVDRNGVSMLQGGGTEILAGHGGIHGPGGQFILHDVDGDLLVYHYYDDQGAARLGINKLSWSGDWPTVV
ncbi:endo-1,5-alpha-L-arabinosidase [Violaceomyces palustris]|uniref:Endo-1,5-alpha-L-arabinosidase n=1 Tax=Violaceomyces palustris TaxID=1673888 RepID=A0ACD0NRR9_9BASI|nr:endo-1,5-alpha-L-arabinosidase [Violaceomyces palustris]